jgi:hypothetical protein
MMKTIKKRLNLYTKNILIGWGSCLFLEFTFVFFTSNISSRLMYLILILHVLSSSSVGIVYDPLFSIHVLQEIVISNLN